jgi:flagellar hook-associated protein 2
MRYTGLSGIDTESMVTALMKAEGMKLDKLRQQNQLTLWKQSAYYSASDIFKTFQNSFLALGSANSARLSSTFLRNNSVVKNSAGADSSTVKITDASGAELGKYTVDVKQLATKDTYTGASGSAGSGIVSTADWNDPAVYDNLKNGDSIKISLDGTSKSLKFTQTDIDSIKAAGGKAAKFQEVLQNKLNDAFGEETVGNPPATVPKVKAEMNGGALTITASQGHTAIIQGAALRDTAITAGAAPDISSLGLPSPDSSDGVDFNLKVSQNGTDSIITFRLKGDMTAEQAASSVNKAISEALPEITSGLKAAVNSDGKLVFSVGTTDSTVTVSNDDNPQVLAALGFSGDVTIDPTNALNDFGFTAGDSTKMNLKLKLSEVFNGVPANVNFEINGHVFNFDSANTSVQDLINDVNNANIGVKLSFDSLNENFKLEAAETGAANALKITDASGFLQGSTGLKLSQTADQMARDSRFIFNGIETTRGSNNIEIAGIRMELGQITSDSAGAAINGGPVTLTIEKDTAGTVDFIKKFVEAYNTMIDSLNSTLTTNRPKKDSYNYYEPLTDEQKESMKENDIKNWEEKAQQGMLYNDDLLQSVSGSLRGMIYQSVELSNGTKLSLYEIGITTSNDFRDGGKLIIDEDKLTRAVESRSGDIAQLFTKSADIPYKPGVNDKNRIAQEGIAERMNDIINSAIGTSGAITKRAGMKGDTMLEMSSSMYKTLRDQNDRITEMLAYLQQKETDYYAIFSRMEQAITQANSQMAYLQAQLGV